MKFLHKLRREAAKSDHRAFPHSTVVLRGGAPIAFGYNLGTRHSEEAAFDGIWPSERVGTTIINIRVKRGGGLGLAFPCEDCQRRLRLWQVRKVFFSNGEGGFGVWRP
jgi:hypothetical protein